MSEIKSKDNKINLVLLIGTNPLPNYVIAWYLKDEIHKLILIHSEENNNQTGTLNYASEIQERIQLENTRFISLKNIGSALTIHEDLENKLHFDNKDYLIHLNYTGGTKTMAVHVHDYIKEFGRDTKFSYLDVRTYKIIYDNGNFDPPEGNLRDRVNLDIDTILGLHLYQKKEKKEIGWPRLALKRLTELVRNDNIKLFLDWMRRIRVIYKNGRGHLETTSKYLQSVEDPCVKKAIEQFEKMPDEILGVLNAFPEERRINDNNEKKLWLPNEDVSNKNHKGRIRNTFEFLDGKWLEAYIYKELKSEVNGLKDGINFGWSLEATKENGISLELDLFLIRGYQLIGISITTDSKRGLCKHKGFEVIHRVRQIGGEEGIAILVTALSRDLAEGLQKDLYHTTGSAQDKIFVFGMDDWKEIGIKINQEVGL